VKKAFLMLISLAMCFLLLAIPALAGGVFDFYNYPVSRDGAGWSWNEAGSTLTLNGLDFEFICFTQESSDNMIRLPSDSTVILKGANTFSSIFGGISAEGNLTIDGSGSLAINAVSAMNGDVTLNGGTLAITPTVAFGVGFMGRNITINDGALTINNAARGRARRSAITASNSVAINGGSLTINSGNIGIIAMGCVAINDGSVVINDADNAGIQAIGGITINGGFLAIKNAAQVGIASLSSLTLNGGSGTIEAFGQYALAIVIGRDINVGDGVTVKGWDESANNYTLQSQIIRVVLPPTFELGISPRNTFAGAAQNVPLRNIHFNSAAVVP